MRARSDLILDIGVCNGDDSAYYLHKGYRVVGLEANPMLLPRLRDRFAQEIHAGRYHLLGLGISEAEGEAEFWVCDDRPEWSSFDRTVASRNGSRHHSETVPTCRFLSVIEKFGIPVYCKIDIEGNDNLCLKDMPRNPKPKFLSIEHIRHDRQIELLKDLGYNRFKIVSQLTLRPPIRALALLKTRLPLWFHKQFLRVESRLARHGFDGQWRFPRGSSGPFGENTPGKWLNAEEAVELLRIIDTVEDAVDWHDIHAWCEKGRGTFDL
jgi:FkbM family methyltransferase